MIPLTKPTVAFDEIADDIRRILESGRLTDGPYVRTFESRVARYVGTAHAVATTSATSALHLVLAAAGIRSGDEVLVADFTFPATGNVVAQCGATPVLVDSVAAGFEIDLDDAANKLSPRTRALIIVDPFGDPADLDRASAFCSDHDILLVEDAACALGAHRAGRRCGSWPGAGCFSFHPRKVITTGEGGMVTTDDAGLADRVRLLRSHGGVPEGVAMRFATHGFNYRLSEIQAAIGCAQMRRLDEILAGRRRAAAAYLERLPELSGVTPPNPGEGATFQSLVVTLEDGVDRDAVCVAMRAAGVEATLGTYALHAHAAFSVYGYRPGQLPNSYRAQRQSLTLPLWPGMAEDVVEQVTRTLREAIEGQRGPAGRLTAHDRPAALSSSPLGRDCRPR